MAPQAYRVPLSQQPPQAAVVAPPVVVERFNMEKLKRLSPEILQELEAVDASKKFMPGKVGIYSTRQG